MYNHDHYTSKSCNSYTLRILENCVEFSVEDYRISQRLTAYYHWNNTVDRKARIAQEKVVHSLTGVNKRIHS